jgi:ribosomal protein S18 acetylase RimI-like enzyme
MKKKIVKAARSRAAFQALETVKAKCSAQRKAGPAGPLACELRVRPYREKDFKALAAVWLAGGITLDDSDSAAALERNLDRAGYRIFVGEAQRIDSKRNLPVGKPRVAGGAITTFDGHRAYIYHLAVHRDFRGLGLGRALLEACERQAQHWGASHLRLSCKIDGSREIACHLYASANWSRDDGISTYRKTL